VGTSSTRRRAQLLTRRPDLQFESIRGNVDTRIRKVHEGQYDAIVLAVAGLTRLGLTEQITAYLPFEVMLPAPGQGALAVQCRADDERTLALFQALDHAPTRLAVTAERAFLAALGGGCSLPVGAYATVSGTQISLQGALAAPDGSRSITLYGTGTVPEQVGCALAAQAINEGAAELFGSEFIRAGIFTG
jgi:hydroxymethylbilane synthase